MQIAPEVMREDVAQIHREQGEIGYDSLLIEGEEDCTRRPRVSACSRSQTPS